jgi:hypothetical protein
MINYISKILTHVRRPTQPSNFFKGSFKAKTAEEENKQEMVENEMNRRITILFAELHPDLLLSIMDGISDVMSSNPSDVRQMVETIVSLTEENEIKRVNLLTTNLDDTVD